MKKILSLLLVLALMLSVLVIPAAAAVPDEDIMEPCAFMDCPCCGQSVRIYSSISVAEGRATIPYCPNYDFSHDHYHERGCIRYILECPNCGTFSYYRPSFCEFDVR